MTIRVTTAEEAARIDARAVALGTPTWTLMNAAGARAADLILARLPQAATRGVAVFAGAGNNGGDAWVVAAQLAARGIAVKVVEVEQPGTDDARRARDQLPATLRVTSELEHALLESNTGVVVDGLLGTGAHGAPRANTATAIAAIGTLRQRGATVVSLDIPSGVDATTGATAGTFVQADLTVTFGTLKRGLLRNRDAAGAIVLVDIGVGAAADADGAPEFIGQARALGVVPGIPASANKNSRRRLLVVGGAAGMAGAAILAARGALRSGIGMVKLCVEPASVPPAQAAVPAALTAPWPLDDSVLADYLGWAECVLIGPGLGLSRASRELAMHVLTAWKGPVVVDADALTHFQGNADRLGELLAGRPAVVTPHAGEAERLAGIATADVDTGRFDVAARIATRVHAAVLLKGVPTVISDSNRTVVVAAGTPVLGTGGSGDVLGGIVATLLSQTSDAMGSAAAGAWVHGRAAEIAGAGRVRGITLDDVVAALPSAWLHPSGSDGVPWVLAELPAVGEGRR